MVETACPESDVCKANVQLIAQFFGDSASTVAVNGVVNLIPDASDRRTLEEDNSTTDAQKAGFEFDVQLEAPVSSATFLGTGWARATGLSLTILASFLIMSI